MLLMLSLMLGLAVSGADLGPAGGAGLAASPRVPGISEVRPVPDPQNALYDLVNRTRAQAGLPELAWDNNLADAARDHAKAMAEHGVLSHQLAGESPLLERLIAHRVRLDRASENVVYDLSPQGAHENFMSSAPHRANLLDPAFDSVGIGVAEIGGILYITEDFAHRVANVPDDEASQIVAKTFNSLRHDAGAEELSFVTAPRLHEMALEMAQRETPAGQAGLSLPGARFAASYATADLAKVPAPVARLAGLHGLTHYSVGACYARTPKYPAGLYWVAIVLFQSSELQTARVQ